MNQELWTGVDRYLDEKFAPNDDVLARVLSSSASAGMPPHNVSATQGKFLQIITRMIGAKSILEIGTLGGYSTIWLGRALDTNGELFSLEANADWANVARKNIVAANLACRIEIQTGFALDLLAQLQERGKVFDLIFIDANKDQNPDYLLSALKLSHEGTVIIADNVIRDGAVVDQRSEDPRVQGIRRLNEMIANEPRITATTLQTVGAKGYDGFTIALVTSD